MQDRNSRFHIHKNLASKYTLLFNFFRPREINPIIYNKNHSAVKIKYHDVIHQSDSTEYLRRLYYVTNHKGNMEIGVRLKWLIDYYKMNPGIIVFEYPTMYITETYDIFILRLKRLHRKSLNSSLVHSSLPTQSYMFILNGKNENSSGFGRRQLHPNSLLLLESFSLHNIYSQESSSLLINASIQEAKTSSLDEIILNFEDLDVDFINSYFRYHKGNLSKENKDMIIKTHEPLENEQTDKKKTQMQYIEDRLMKDEERYLRNRQKYLQDHYIKKYRMGNMGEKVNNEENKRKKNAVKMKDKAKNLLNKIQKMDFVSRQIDLNPEI